MDEGETFIRLTLAEALEAGGEPDAARSARTKARDRLRARAEKINDERCRASFLTSTRLE